MNLLYEYCLRQHLNYVFWPVTVAHLGSLSGENSSILVDEPISTLFLLTLHDSRMAFCVIV